jgi:hypothetical protein
MRGKTVHTETDDQEIDADYWAKAADAAAQPNGDMDNGWFS